MYTPKQSWAIDCVTYWWNEFNLFYKTNLTPCPAVRFDRAKARAGFANSRHNVVSFSNFLLESEPNFEQTIGHEVCHIFVNKYFNRNCGHNSFWVGAMENLGLESSRCHSYTSAIVGGHRPSTALIMCNCGIKLPLGKVRQQNIIYGRKNYSCVKCGTRITKDML